MEEKEVFQYFILLSGMNPEQAAGWEPLCSACMEELRVQLRPSVEERKHAGRLTLAAATLANYRFQLLQSGGVDRFRVGEISCSGGGPERIKKELLEMIGDLLDYEGVELKSVVIR